MISFPAALMQRPGCEPESLITTQRRPVAKKKDVTAYMSQSATSSCAVDTSMKKVCDYPNMVVDEVRWSDRLNHYNHSPHFPFLLTHFTDCMPIGSITPPPPPANGPTMPMPPPPGMKNHGPPCQCPPFGNEQSWPPEGLFVEECHVLGYFVAAKCCQLSMGKNPQYIPVICALCTHAPNQWLNVVSISLSDAVLHVLQ